MYTVDNFSASMHKNEPHSPHAYIHSLSHVGPYNYFSLQELLRSKMKFYYDTGNAEAAEKIRNKLTEEDEVTMKYKHKGAVNAYLERRSNL